MKIRLSVGVGIAGAGAREVTITVPESCSPEARHAGAIAILLAQTLGAPGDALALRDRLLPGTAVLGDPPLVDGASVRLVEQARWSAPHRSPRSAATEVAVIGGPDAGHTRALTSGEHTVGRAGADLTIADPSLSRLHLSIEVSPAGITVRDRGSENGTLVDGEALLDGCAPVRIGTVLRVGQSTLTLRVSRTPPAVTAARGDGTITVSRAVMPITEPTQTRIEVPLAPVAPPRRRVPWVAALLPVPIALGLAWAFGPHLLLFALMSPLMILGNVISDRVGARRTYAEETRAHRRALAACETRREAALAAERGWREKAFPDLASVGRLAIGPGAALWSRPVGRDRPLVVRLGRGTVRSGVTWVDASEPGHALLPDAPVLLDLVREGSLSISGPVAHPVADGIIGQLVTLHSPAELTVLTDRRGWSSVPHVRHDESGALIHAASRRIGADDDPPGPVVLAVDGHALESEDLTTLSAVCRDGPAHGVLTIVTGAAVTAARSHITTTADRTVWTRADGTDGELSIDAVGPSWVGRVARALTPLRDGSGERTDLPQSVRLSEALGLVGAASPPDLRSRWSGADDGAWVTLGATATAPLRLDLAVAGPHAIVGGTTGSGKSELLRTLVTSLACEHPPEELAIVLVDYKGGSAFAGLEHLPHVVGVVTDLDPALTQRALASLTAEVRRREAIIATLGAPDIATYRQLGRRSLDAPRLARLVIVVDEFRALADELPEFVNGLVRLAAVGRSLGIHLVLATQRPAGVVTADMRANLSLRIALRVRDRADSQDVIDSDAAASLPRSIAGRALLRAGADPLETFQTALVSRPTEQPRITMQVRWSDGSLIRREFPVTSATEDLDLVELVAEAARAGNHCAPPSPWLPALPSSIAWSPEHPRSAWAVLDDPAQQRQEPAAVDLATLPHTAIAGSVGSGRTTTALSLALAALAGHPDAHLYAVADPTGPLTALRDLPHTGAVIDRADPAALAWFADRLAARLREPRAAYLLVVIDGWDVLADVCDRLDHGALTDRLLATIREGYALGLRAVITGDRSVLTGRVSRTFPARYLHRPADDTDLVLAGLRASAGPAQWLPGRLLDAADGMEHQVLVRAVRDVELDPPSRPPWRIATLPPRVDTTTLPRPAGGLIPIGLGGDGGPVVIGATLRRRLLVLGSPGSGRTSALATVAYQAAAAGRTVCVVAEPHEDLARRTRHLLGASSVSWTDDEALIAVRRAHPDLVVVADDVERHLDSPLVPMLEQIAELVDRDGGLIAVSCDAAAVAMRQRGVGVSVARGRTSVVLGAPSPLDRDVVGALVPRPGEIIPGRGWFIADRAAVPLQIAIPAALSSSRGVPAEMG